MGYEKPAYAACDAIVRGQPWKHPDGPGGQASPNHRLFHAALDYVAEVARYHDYAKRKLETVGSLPPSFLIDGRSARDRVLAIGRSQAHPKPGAREGIGVVESGWEQGPGDHHVTYHLLATYTIALVAARHGDDEVLDLYLTVAGRWFAMWCFGEYPVRNSARVAVPGARFWPFKGDPKPGEDGLVHLEPGETLNWVADACYQRLANLPVLDNKLKGRSFAWALQRGGTGSAALLALAALLDTGTEIPLNLSCELHVPIVKRERKDGHRLWLESTEAGIGGYIQGFAPAVQVTYGAGELPQVAWAPHVIPSHFQEGS